MGIRTVEVSKEVEETVDVKICDRCGYECDEGGRKLYFNPRVELRDQYRHLIETLSTRHAPDAVRYSESRMIQDSLKYVELQHDGYVRVCMGCRETMFGWLSDEGRLDAVLTPGEEGCDDGD